MEPDATWGFSSLFGDGVDSGPSGIGILPDTNATVEDVMAMDFGDGTEVQLSDGFVTRPIYEAPLESDLGGGSAAVEEPPAMVPNDVASMSDVLDMFPEQDNDDEDSMSLVDDQANNYDFRPGFRNQEQTDSTWLDNDESGNYDPSVERARLYARRRKSRFPANHSPIENEPTSDEEYMSTDGRGPVEEVVRRIVVLKLISIQGKELLSRMIDLQLYSGRTRSDKLHLQANDRQQDDDKQRPNLTGHPAARGCWKCFELGLNCPLLDDAETWPCQFCDEDDHDCELITPATRKKSCENCRKRKVLCSYPGSLDQSDPCEECQDAGYHCIAGPVKAFIRPRICYSASPRTRVGAGTSEDDLHVSARKQHDIPQRPRRRPSKRRKQHRHSGDPVHYHADTHKVGQHVKQKTSPLANPLSNATRLTQPIELNFEDLSGQKACSFCSHPAFPVFGPAAAALQQSILGGNTTTSSLPTKADPDQPTRICITCTFSRMRLCICNPHEMGPINDAEVQGTNYNDAFSRLLAGSPIQSDRWCSICPSTALYQCGRNTAGVLQSDGCGLQLCEPCAVALCNTHQGNLYNLLDSMVDEPTETRPFGLRADSELLRSSGPLVRFMHNM